MTAFPKSDEVAHPSFGKTLIGSTLLCLALVACGGSETTVNNQLPANNLATGNWYWKLPSNFPYPVEPPDNPMTHEKVELGRYLFYDKRLSGNGTQSCGTCHQQSKAFTDGLAQAVGATGDLHPRNAQSLVNVIYSPTFTWANPALVSLESQMQTPMFSEHPIEMGINESNKTQILSRIQADTHYQDLFAKAFGNDKQAITYDNIVKAIASFERSIVSADSKYDRYLQGKAQLTAQELRGKDLFNGEKAECFHCHGSFNFNDQVKYASQNRIDTPFHNTGLYNLDNNGSYPQGNGGVFELSGQNTDMGKFRAPSLRNVAITAPYNHDGSTKTLEEVLANYAAGGRNITTGQFVGDGRKNPYKDDLIVKIDLSTQEQADIVAFLRTLTDETVLTDPRFSDPFAK